MAAAPTPGQGYRPDRLLVDRIAGDDGDRAAAEAAAAAVLHAVAQLLGEGKYVRLPGVGRLTTRLARKWVPGTRNKRAVEQRVATLQDAAVISRGEPYDV